MTLDEAKTVCVGTPLIYSPSNTLFGTLCNCADSFPRHFMLDYVKKFPQNYRFPTSEELKTMKRYTPEPSKDEVMMEKIKKLALADAMKRYGADKVSV